MTLSVLIPAYNPGPWLRRIIVSLENQIARHPDTEIIVVDDGSIESLEWTRNYPHVRYARTDNGGESRTRNLCMALAMGEYIQFLDADDIIYDNCLDVVYENIEAGYDWVAYDWECDGSTSRAVQNHGVLMLNCAVWAYTFKKSYIDGLQFDERFIVGADVDWLGRLLTDDCKHRHDPRVFYNYRWAGNENSLCHRNNRGEFA